MPVALPPPNENPYRLILWTALAVNATMFGVELVASIVARSVSLRADALDFPRRCRKLCHRPCRGRLGATVARESRAD